MAQQPPGQTSLALLIAREQKCLLRNLKAAQTRNAGFVANSGIYFLNKAKGLERRRCLMSPILPFILLLSFGASVLAQPAQGIVGTWEFVSAKTTREDGTTAEFTTHDLRSTKILNQTYFCVVTRNADGSFRHTNVGPYDLEGDLYTETLEYSTNPNWTGSKAVYKSKVEGDLWYIDTLGDALPRRGEVWRRVQGARDAVEF
jgi:hypothetical protein